MYAFFSSDGLEFTHPQAANFGSNDRRVPRMEIKSRLAPDDGPSSALLKFMEARPLSAMGDIFWDIIGILLNITQPLDSIRYMV